MELSMRSLVGRQISTVQESETSVLIRLTDGNSIRVAKTPMSDCRRLIDNWSRLFNEHILQTIPPAHPGYFIIDFGEDGTGPTTCSGNLTSRGTMTIPAGYSAVKVTAKAGTNSTAVPKGMTYEIKEKGTIQVVTGTATIEQITSPASSITVEGSPGLVVTVRSNLDFTYKLAGDQVARAGSMVVEAVTSVPATMTSQAPALMMTGQMTLSDGTKLSGVRQTSMGTTIGDSQETLVVSSVQMGAQLKEFKLATEETVVLQIQNTASPSTLSYNMAQGVSASYTYCEYEVEPPKPGDQACPTQIVANDQGVTKAYAFPQKVESLNIVHDVRSDNNNPLFFLMSSTDLTSAIEILNHDGTMRLGYAVTSPECIGGDSGDSADLAVQMAKTWTDTPVIGATVTYTVTAINKGPRRVQGAALGILIPEQLLYVGASPTYSGGASGPSAVSRNGQSISLNIANLPTNGQVVVTITVKTSVRGTFVTASTITSSMPDPVPSNNEASLQIEVR